MSDQFAFYECLQPLCRFRFPAQVRGIDSCPLCGQSIRQATPALTAEFAATADPSPIVPLHLMLDNIRSLHNVGSIFRTADGAGVAHLYLCGITPTPDNPRLAKTSLGAENSVPWSYHRNGVETAVLLQQSGHQLWAMERTSDSRPLFQSPPLATDRPVVLVLGNEKAGVDPGLLALCEQTVHLPMAGIKQSLNVAVVAGTAVYHLLYADKTGEVFSISRSLP